MPNRTIWINTKNIENFDKEENKSGLVNRLLAGHFNLKRPQEKVDPKGVAAIFNGETCQGHEMKWDCGLPGCKYA